MNYLTRNTGFSLIEVLVSMLVLALGTLGVSSVQLFGLQESAHLYYRTQADLLIADIAERLRTDVDTDLAKWQQAINESKIPGGQGSVFHVADQYNQNGQVISSIYRVKIAWMESRTASAPEVSSDGCDSTGMAETGCRELLIAI